MTAATLAPVTGTVHSWDLSIGVDGPGTRFVTFLSGCPLRCLYCQNPDTWLRANGTRQTSDEMLTEAAKYVPFITAAGGGATLSGGEPLQQPEFASALLHGFKELGLHTALDTSGYLGPLASEELLAATDLVLLDIKAGRPETYRRLTARELEPTLRFAERLAALGTPIWLRYVLVPGRTDAPEEIGPVARFATGLGNVERVDVLPFHTLGQSKWEALNRRFVLAGTPTPTPEQVELARHEFQSYGLVAY
ncbi:pyruvate formate lyase-activating protein [Nocardia sp. 2]|uniref:Pyruvate formate-lyase-activating enzyme n=1 Tax=Nocardia acididurans TaxID=2802282 RepID=A0ABS1MD54_9NOCA|nr:pyruvate formate-lyase-activating protein [Nocardia acididurans]MBL1078573.1 pyruvate formate lyase-activating protein [Nocardia acididurans]